MKSRDFRRIALGMKGAVEGSHMHADDVTGMVKLTPEQQQAFMKDHPKAFVPENGAWGRQGCTAVRLAAVDEETLGEALTLAWRNRDAAKRTPARRARRGGV